MALTRGEQGHQYRPAVPGRVLPGPPGPPPNRPRRLRALLIGLATFLAAGGIAFAHNQVMPRVIGAQLSITSTVAIPSPLGTSS